MFSPLQMEGAEEALAECRDRLSSAEHERDRLTSELLDTRETKLRAEEMAQSLGAVLAEAAQKLEESNKVRARDD